MKSLIKVLFAGMFALSTSCTFIQVKDGAKVSFGGKTLTASKNLVRDTLAIPDFTGLDVALGCDFEYTQTSGAPFLSYVIADNLKDNLVVNVEDGILKVYYDGINPVGNSSLKIVAGSSVLKSLYIKGALDLNIPKGLNVPSFTADVKGACDVEIDGLKAKEIVVNVEGACDMEVEDVDAETIDIKVDGAGDISLEGRADFADIAINGAGVVDISKLDYKDVSTSVKGLGSVKKRK